MTRLCFLVFGAPGAGKSTLLRTLPKHGRCTAIDLENIGGIENYKLGPPFQTEKRKRLHFLSLLQDVDFKVPLFVGAADLAPREFPKGYEVIFLHHADKAAYHDWVQERDQRQPDKAGQGHLEMYDHMSTYKKNHRPKLDFDPSLFRGEADRFAIAIWDQIDPGCTFHAGS